MMYSVYCKNEAYGVHDWQLDWQTLDERVALERKADLERHFWIVKIVEEEI